AKEVNPKLKAYVVINRASTNPFLAKKIESLKEYVKDLEEDYIILTNTIVYEREKYKIATQMGLSVVEMDEKNNKAFDEIQSLCKEISKDIK
ncbi:chromosome partitioning protein ParA, partial [Campylobacter fetus subsp. testudinum]